jgi:hypothetical protein
MALKGLVVGGVEVLGTGGTARLGARQLRVCLPAAAAARSGLTRAAPLLTGTKSSPMPWANSTTSHGAGPSTGRGLAAPAGTGLAAGLASGVASPPLLALSPMATLPMPGSNAAGGFGYAWEPLSTAAGQMRELRYLGAATGRAHGGPHRNACLVFNT